MKYKLQFNKTRPLSWSSFNCFSDKQWGDKEEWYRRYVLGIKPPPTRQLLFGSMIDKKIQDDPTFLPELERFPKMQYEMKPVYNKIPLIGFADGWDPKKLRLKDDKTGVTPWTQKRADETGQITMYLFMLYLMHGIKPEQVECRIDWLPTVQNADLSIMFAKPFKIQSFYTKRSLTDILKFAKQIETVWSDMEQYAKKHK